MLKDYYDSVRDQACTLLEYLIMHFIRKSPVHDADRENLLHMLKASVKLGFSSHMERPTFEAAEAEKEMLSYMFEDAQEFLKLLITTMMDEPSTRESIIRVILRLNKEMPFLLLNDFRIACANNSLQRQEVIKGLLERATN